MKCFKKTALLICLFFSIKLNSQFVSSYKAGTKDANNNFMGGTEMRVFANHKGKLYGGIETWMDDTTGTCDPFIGAMILRLDAPNGNWYLDKHFNTFFPNNTGREKKRNEGITALESIIFTSDKNGVALPKPDTILIAAARDFTGILSVYTRNDNTGVWTETVVGTVPIDTTGNTDNDGTIRSFALYKDKITGIENAFAGSLPNGIISGAYDASLPGKIAWRTKAELTGFVGRPMAFAICNGDLFCAIAPSVFKRNDGPSPTWSPVYTYPFNVYPGGSSGLRGLTTIKNPNGAGQSLLAALEGNPSQIYRLDVTSTPPFTATIEYNTLAAMTTAFGYPANYLVVANSEMTWVTEPNTGDSVLTITIQHHPALYRDDAYYLIRKQVGSSITYTLKNIDNKLFAPFTVLNSTRAIINSPFAGDNNALYIGGYDADNNVSHNTAYALRASKNTFFGTIPTQPQLSGLKRYIVQPSLTQSGITDSFFAHTAYINTSLVQKNKLVVFLAGTNSPNSAYENFLKTSVQEGYHVIGLAYRNSPTMASLCGNSNDSLCFDKVRNEIIDGIDRTNLVPNLPLNSIYNRLAKLIAYLQTNYPNDNWGQYINGNNILWNQIIISGHSQGGGHAALIAKQNIVDKVVMLAAPKDYFTAPLNKAAAWINSSSLTNPSKYYGFVHQNDNQGCTPAQQLEIFNRLGMSSYGAPYDVQNNDPNFANSHTLITSIPGLTSANAHAIVAVDVLAASVCSVPIFTNAWKYLLNNNPVVTAISNITINNPGIKVFPNPVTQNIFKIQSETLLKRIEIINTAGQQVYLNQSTNKEITIQAPWPSGFYSIKITESNGKLNLYKILINSPQ